MAINKIIYGGQTLIDLTGDTITKDKVLSGFTFHGIDGTVQEGACTFDVDSQDATVKVAEMLTGKTAYARGSKLTGTMKNNGAVAGTISAKDGVYTVPQGYHDGSGTVKLAKTETDKLISTNIREGVTIFGVEGSMSGSEDETPQDNINVTPSKLQQIITPGEGYTCLRQVTVAAIPYVEQQNAAGGITVTIG